MHSMKKASESNVVQTSNSLPKAGPSKQPDPITTQTTISTPFIYVGAQLRRAPTYVGAQLRSQPILRWAIAQLRILSWVAYLKMG